MTTLQDFVRATVPRPLRIRMSRALGEVVSAGTRRELGRLARGTRPILVGPWLGEVGFELLYWIPFVAWFAERFAVNPDRLVVFSRGGVESWYRHLSRRYRDIFDYVSPSEFKAGNEGRTAEMGEQKQLRVTAFERMLLDGARRDLGLADAGLLHPSTMYRTLRPFWWGHASAEWVHRHTRHQRLLPSPAWPAEPQGPYIAVKFYFNDCFPATTENRAFVTRTLTRLAGNGRVVSLATGLQLDDHHACEAEIDAVRRLGDQVEPRNNLDVQTAIVARARAFVGTYGGFAYLAPFYGVPATGVYSREDGFSGRHLDMAHAVFRTFSERPILSLCRAEMAAPPVPVLVQ